MSQSNPASTGRSPAQLVLTLAALVFGVETLVMLILAALPALPVLVGAFFDAALTSALLAPAFYLFMFRPLVQQISARRLVETEALVERMRVFRATMRTVHDIFNNGLNRLQLVRYEAEGRIPHESIEAFDRTVREMTTNLKALEALEVVVETQMALGAGVKYETTWEEERPL
jgi:hypothetical protein